jgi:uncharacterized protein (TIGR03000 family)
MFRSKLLSTHRAALALAAVFLFAGESQAQRFVSFYVPLGGGGYYPYGGYSPYGGGYYPYGGYSPYGGGYSPYGGGYSPYGGGYSPYGGGYSPYGGGYSPYGGGYYSPSYYYTSPSYMSSYTSTSYIVPVLTSTSSSPRTINEKAAIEVQVPANAQVWFDGTQTAQKGSERYFATPALQRGKNYTYEVRATWTDDKGNAVTQTREVTVEPGKWSVVNFLEKSSP